MGGRPLNYALDVEGDLLVQSQFRAWINRDDGRLFRAGNRRISWWTAGGTFFVITGITLGQLRRTEGFSYVWVAAAFLLGFIFLVIGTFRELSGQVTEDSDVDV